MTESSRTFECPNRHVWKVPGVDHWNPWGSPDFEVTNRASLDCPTCGESGQKSSDYLPGRCGVCAGDGSIPGPVCFLPLGHEGVHVG